MAALVAVFLARAGVGWVAGFHEIRGRRLSAAGHLEGAIDHLDRGAFGENRPSTLWLAGEVRLGLYQRELSRGASRESLEPILVEAFRAETAATSLSPASGWARASLADVYHQQERQQLYHHGLPLDMVGEDRWAFVGPAGRIAIGLLREAIEREPTQYLFYDQLAFALLDYGLTDAALEVVRESAFVQPDFFQHEYRRLRPLSPAVLDTFAAGSREALGRVPLIQQFGHLLALAKLELQRGNATTAEQDLRAALELSATRLQRADAHYRLGLALRAQLRYDEAIEHLVLSEEEPVFRAAALAVRSTIADERGQLETALSLMRKARRLKPYEIGYALAYARMAVAYGRYDWAEEALWWANKTHSRDARPLRRLEEILLEQGKRQEASKVREELRRLEAPKRDDANS